MNLTGAICECCRRRAAISDSNHICNVCLITIRSEALLGIAEFGRLLARYAAFADWERSHG